MNYKYRNSRKEKKREVTPPPVLPPLRTFQEVQMDREILDSKLTAAEQERFQQYLGRKRRLAEPPPPEYRSWME